MEDLCGGPGKTHIIRSPGAPRCNAAMLPGPGTFGPILDVVNISCIPNIQSMQRLATFAMSPTFVTGLQGVHSGGLGRGLIGTPTEG